MKAPWNTGAALLLAAPLAWAGGPAAVDAQRLTAADSEPGNWMSTGRTYGEQRYSPLEQVNEQNVGQLGLAWDYGFGLHRVVEATPLVVDGVMYTTSAYSIVHALDARTGKLLWQYDPGVYRGIQGSGCCDAAPFRFRVRRLGVERAVPQDCELVGEFLLPGSLRRLGLGSLCGGCRSGSEGVGCLLLQPVPFAAGGGCLLG